MKYKYLFLTLALVGLSLSGCYYGHREGVIQSSNDGYLQFFANDRENLQVRVDEGEWFVPEFADKDARAAYEVYSLKPGVHIIQVERNGTLVMKRKVYVGRGETLKIEIQ